MGITRTAAVAITVLAALPLSGKSANFVAIATKVADNSPVVRVNQVGYVTGDGKGAFVMLPKRVSVLPFTVTSGNQVVFRGVSRSDLGSWNGNYRAVYGLDFSSLRTPGTYRIHVGSAVSPAFQVADAATLFTGLVSNAVKYFTSERDGADVDPSVLNRQPANLTDESALVYAPPDYDANDSLLGGFTRLPGGQVDVSGGWFDAGGGYEKFAYTVTYADALMLIAQRQFPHLSAGLGPEANFGLQWLAKLWNPVQKELFIQVGIGNGSAPSKGFPNGKIQGDYNFWFLPQSEDRMDVRPGHNPGPTAYFVKYRPVFAAAPAGQRVSPDLAGRFAADFALGAQIAQAADPAAAQQLLRRARSVFADARTSNVGQIVTSYPHDYYPGAQWKSDMLWGATEIALADEATGAPASTLAADLAIAASWARQYLAQAHADTLNLYDPGAVAEAELLQAMRNAGGTPVVAPSALLNDMAAQLRLGESLAKSDPFHPAITVGTGDLTPHAFGMYITNALYRGNGGSGQFQSFAQQQLNYALGANPWGVSFVVGAGSSFPHCMQSEIANLAGSLSGAGSVQVGATTDGPSATANFTGLGSLPTMKTCSFGSYGPFNTKTASYEDTVPAWPSVEPAADYSANSLFAFALGAAGLG